MNSTCTPARRDLHETYLPAFQALVQEAHVDAVMGAYNRVNGEPATASQRLLVQTLRGKWGFKGYVVSDCDAVGDIFKTHKTVETAEQAAALAVKNGDDLNCGRTYAALPKAVEQGLLKESQIDGALTPADDGAHAPRHVRSSGERAVVEVAHCGESGTGTRCAGAAHRA